MNNTTLGYYDSHANDFYNSTVNVEFAATQEHFFSKLNKGDYILDFGCGSGRDTKYFLEQGYLVDAIDGSKELCKMATEYTGIEVKQMYFQELSALGKYDAIWACSSILHLDRDGLKDVFNKMANALKSEGVIYTSFKYGEFEGERGGRYFIDFTPESFEEYMQEIMNLQIEEYWITCDVRPGRGEEKWLNLILRKSEVH